MNTREALVRENMRLTPVFAKEDDNLLSVLEAMKKFKVDSIAIVKEDFAITGYIDKNKIKETLKHNRQINIGLLKEIKASDIVNQDFPIILYPKMKITDAYSIMKCFNLKCLPVVDVPWDKKIIGFLWLEDVVQIIEKDYIKIPV